MLQMAPEVALVGKHEAMAGGSGDVSMCEVGRWVLPGITVRFSPSPVADVEAENLSLPHTCNTEGVS